MKIQQLLSSSVALLFSCFLFSTKGDEDLNSSFLEKGIADLPEFLVKARMDALFKLIDNDNNNKLSREEIKGWMERVGEMSKYRIQRMHLSTFDSNNDSQISLTEYINTAATMPNLEVDPEMIEVLQTRFKDSDTDEDGFIRGDEIDRLMKETTVIPENFDQYAMDILADHDSDESGVIEFEEFLALAEEEMAEENYSKNKDVNSPLFDEMALETTTLTESDMEMVKQEFETLDENKDGVIDKDEIRRLLDQDPSINETRNDYSPEKIESHIASIFSIVNKGGSEGHSATITYDDVHSHLTQFASSVMTDSGEILRVPEDYNGLDSLAALDDAFINGSPASTTTMKASPNVEL